MPSWLALAQIYLFYSFIFFTTYFRQLEQEILDAGAQSAANIYT
jgi:hypothetical protein